METTNTKTEVNVIHADGEIEFYCSFVNKESEFYNMTTLCMEENHVSAIWDNNLRKKYEQKIVKGISKRTLSFEHGDDVYICLTKR